MGELDVFVNVNLLQMFLVIESEERNISRVKCGFLFDVYTVVVLIFQNDYHMHYTAFIFPFMHVSKNLFPFVNAHSARVIRMIYLSVKLLFIETACLPMNSHQEIIQIPSINKNDCKGPPSGILSIRSDVVFEAYQLNANSAPLHCCQVTQISTFLRST